jgi:hypothetical protein
VVVEDVDGAAEDAGQGSEGRGSEKVMNGHLASLHAGWRQFPLARGSCYKYDFLPLTQGISRTIGEATASTEYSCRSDNAVCLKEHRSSASH